MNANQALQQNDVLTNELLASSKEMATRLNISISEAIDKKVAVYQKHAKNNTQAYTWDVRGNNAKKLINAD